MEGGTVRVKCLAQEHNENTYSENGAISIMGDEFKDEYYQKLWYYLQAQKG